jgi:hypothetical protein
LRGIIEWLFNTNAKKANQPFDNQGTASKDADSAYNYDGILNRHFRFNITCRDIYLLTIAG